MKLIQSSVQVQTRPKSFANITAQMQNVVSESKIQCGLAHLFLRHTSASLIVQENADPDVLADLERFFSRLVPENAHYTHSAEGPDDMPGHIRTVLTQTSLSVPVRQGRLVLGTWQAIYLWEHRAHGSTREVLVTVQGEE